MCIGVCACLCLCPSSCAQVPVSVCAHVRVCMCVYSAPVYRVIVVEFDDETSVVRGLAQGPLVLPAPRQMHACRHLQAGPALLHALRYSIHHTTHHYYAFNSLQNIQSIKIVSSYFRILLKKMNCH